MLEIFSVGPGWKPESGKPGAIWAARRVPVEEVTVISNFVLIREIDLKSPDLPASSNYVQEAIRSRLVRSGKRQTVHLARSQFTASHRG